MGKSGKTWAGYLLNTSQEHHRYTNLPGASSDEERQIYGNVYQDNRYPSNKLAVFICMRHSVG
jgi:hypothetical protein